MNPIILSAAHSAVVKGALSGALAAAVVDFHAFMSFKSPTDVKNYNWGVAAFRWLQGAITGALVGGGLFMAS